MTSPMSVIVIVIITIALLGSSAPQQSRTFSLIAGERGGAEDEKHVILWWMNVLQNVLSHGQFNICSHNIRFWCFPTHQARNSADQQRRHFLRLGRCHRTSLTNYTIHLIKIICLDSEFGYGWTSPFAKRYTIDSFLRIRTSSSSFVSFTFAMFSCVGNTQIFIKPNRNVNDRVTGAHRSEEGKLRGKRTHTDREPAPGDVINHIG